MAPCRATQSSGLTPMPQSGSGTRPPDWSTRPRPRIQRPSVPIRPGCREDSSVTGSTSFSRSCCNGAVSRRCAAIAPPMAATVRLTSRPVSAPTATASRAWPTGTGPITSKARNHAPPLSSPTGSARQAQV
ncbi:hypothetical protein BLA24_13005 [Streptomyces cinnamoneus]|uniref:Uncharacterized protein n=1 Tax=Streptomyces cinnamoneus TaxID=53446 RepID=A0A2G1XK71_STRCJ|nr:hypothetical protein BLA24_13005 [Streptomyces cinnamoneus]